jgi:hypothetical protein
VNKRRRDGKKEWDEEALIYAKYIQKVLDTSFVIKTQHYLL